MSTSASKLRAAWPAAFLALAGCTVGPKYIPPTVDAPAAYHELTPSDYASTDGWRKGEPKDDAIRGKWWEVFHDSDLNALEEQVSVSNQNIAAASAAYVAAQASVKEARSQYFPTVSAAAGITNEHLTIPDAAGVPAGRTFTTYSLPASASWEPDLWGRVRNTVRASQYAAQVSAADLENVRLSAQAELAADYYQLRTEDAMRELLDGAVENWTQTVELNRNLVRAGLANDELVAQAETQLRTSQAAARNTDASRAQYEHAIALLVGKPASTFRIDREVWKGEPPAIPLGVPAALLERRPDIAAAERSMAQANAQIGVAKAAYYPNLTLSASGGPESLSIMSLPSRFWSIGPSLAETVFDAGLRKATMRQYQAIYDQTAANYRQTVLAAFQDVEDNLAALKVLSQVTAQQDEAIGAAARNLAEANVRYRAGLDPYLNVLSAELILLNAREAALTFRSRQMTAGVQLIRALGGGWDSSKLPVAASLSK